MRRAPFRTLAWRTAALFVVTALIVGVAVTPTSAKTSSVAGPVLVRDIVQTPVPSNPYRGVAFGGAVYFGADDGIHCRELFRADPVTQTASLVKDISSSWCSDPEQLVVAGDTLFFRASGPTGVRQIWKSDGTSAGTVSVLDRPVFSDPSDLTAVGETVFFEALDEHGWELWKTDGTASGTMLVKAVNVSDVPPVHLGNFVAVGDLLFFTANDGVHGAELWKSDGTEAGTVIVADIQPLAASSVPASLTAVGRTLYFTAADVAAGRELWKSEAPYDLFSTKLVRDIKPGSPDAFAAGAAMAGIGSEVLFAANNGTLGTELWKSDGTAAGTTIVKDISPSGSSQPDTLTTVGDAVFFTANDGAAGAEPWRSDGTAAGTGLVKDITPGSAGSDPARYASVSGGRAFFVATTGSYGREPYLTDGTAADTGLVQDINPGSSGSDPAVVGAVEGTIFFSAEEPAHARELWRATSPGSAVLMELNPGNLGSWPGPTTAMGKDAYFVVDDGISGRELWKTRGTASSTKLVKDITPGPVGSVGSESSMAAVGSTLFFVASDGSHGAELWRTDGTARGTFMVKDIGEIRDWSGVRGDTPMAVIGTTLFFTADDGFKGRELWRTDGTLSGTTMVTNINPSGWSSPSNFSVVGDTLLFSADDGVHGRELWKTDGTAAGTVMVRDITAGDGSSGVSRPVANGTTIYFVATDGIAGTELWRSSSPYTDATTTLVRDIRPGSESSSPGCLAMLGGNVLFAADDGVNGYELWSSDGTSAGTRLMKDIAPGAADSMYGCWWSEAPVSTGTSALFAANDGSAGRELWITDGTAAGTRLVKDIAPGISWGLQPNPDRRMVMLNGFLYFGAEDGSVGEEIWRSDGTPAGTQLVSDLWPGGRPSTPVWMTATSTSIYMTANDGLHGAELWKL